MDEKLVVQLEQDPLLREAAEWFLELRSDSVSGERIAEWQLWLTRDASHREAFERVEAFWRLSDEVVAHWPTDADVAADRYSGQQGVAMWRAREEPLPPSDERALSPGTPSLRYGLAWAGAIAMAAGIVLAMFLYWPAMIVALEGGSRISVETGVGETRTLTLPDGSVIAAGGDTYMVATLLEHSRTVWLERGEAYFRVAKDRTRPFAVHAAGTTITDIGTAFDVRRTLGGVVVAVAEGIVRVAQASPSGHSDPAGRLPGSSGFPKPVALRLTAGQRLTLDSFDAAPQLTSVNPKWVAGWREGRLQYVDEPLKGVVADLVRYSTRRIVLEDTRSEDLRVTGVVFLNNVDGWLAGLQASFPVRVVKEPDGTVKIMQR